MEDHTSDWLLDAMIECANNTFEHNADLYEDIKQQDRKYRREYNRHSAAIYRRKHPEHVRARNKLRDRNAIKALLIEQGGHCGYCGITLHDDAEIDHIIPLSRGGTSEPDNLIACCRRCNMQKFTMTAAEWQQKRGW